MSDRTCECPGCGKEHEVESVRHFLLVCSHWSPERELLMSNVLLRHHAFHEGVFGQY